MHDTTADLRWGFIGPGRIAANVAADLHLVEGAVLHAVGSRSPDRAKAFADRYGAAVAYGSYGELLADPDVDAVYIATPHRQHHAIALAAVAAGKHLLVEKAFTCTLAGAQEVVAAARAAGVFCMEAMWTRFQPAVVRLRDLLADGAIGEVNSGRADFGRRTPFDPADRLGDGRHGGGPRLAADDGDRDGHFLQVFAAARGGTQRRARRQFRADQRVLDAEDPQHLDRDLCVRYHEAISALLGPGEGATVVITTAKDDPPAWSAWDRDRTAEQAIRDRFTDYAGSVQAVMATDTLLSALVGGGHEPQDVAVRVVAEQQQPVAG